MGQQFASRRSHRSFGLICADFDNTTFAWTGGTSASDNFYYRIQGPTLLIEFQVEGNLGADGGHLHSIYRDPTNEYGKAMVSQ